MRRPCFIAVLLGLFTLLLYWPTHCFDFIYYDDPLFLTDTPELMHGLSWATFRWLTTSVVAANWHPMTAFSFVLTHMVWGVNPGAEHLVNVAFHAANTGLLFFFCWRVTHAVWRSVVVSALFAWHPLRVESVAWIAERKDVMSGFFFLLTLLAYGHYTTATPQTRTAKVRLGVAVVCFALGLLSKPMLVTLPFVLLLLDVWPLRRIDLEKFSAATFRRLLIEKSPLVALAAANSVTTLLVQSNRAAVAKLADVPISLRLSNAVAAYLKYLGQLFWPSDLAVIYPHPANPFAGPPWRIGTTIAGAIALVLLSGFWLWRARRQPFLAIGWFWFVGMMVPVIGLVQVGEQAMADRYTYLPLIGPIMAMVWLSSEAVRSVRLKSVLALVTIVGCVLATRHQLAYWRNSTTLFTHTIAVTGANPTAEFCLANDLEHSGQIAEASPHYHRAQSLQPNNLRYRDALGKNLMALGQWNEAKAVFATDGAGYLEDYTAQVNLALIAGHFGQHADSRAHLETALRANPDGVEALNNLAWLCATSPEGALRDGARAIRMAERACELTGWKRAQFVGTLAAACAEAGQFSDAISHAESAVNLAKQHGETELLAYNVKLLEAYRQHQPAREDR